MRKYPNVTMNATDPPQTLNIVNCPRCKAKFVCFANDPTQPCWCTKLPPVKIPFENEAKDKCFCAECLKEMD